MLSDKKPNDAQLALMVIDRVSALIAYWDKELICQFANGQYLKWFGKKSEEMIGKMTIMELLGPRLYEKNLPYIKAALGGQIQTFEREIRLPTGETRFTLAHYFPDIVNGEVKGFFVQVADVHELKLLEKDLTMSNQIIADQNSRLHNFANIVSHNLKSYSANLDSLLKLFLVAESEQEKDEIFNYLRDLSRAFSGTVGHLTEIVRFQNLQGSDHINCNLSVFANDTVAALKVQIENSNAVIRNCIDPDLVLVTNPMYLQSILLNLLTNALKYHHPQRPPLIELNTTSQGLMTVLTVKDNGVGIDLQKHGSDLFGMNKTFHGNPDAKGIGLYITKYQVDSLGGFIEVESEVGRGTTFSVYLKS